MLACHGGRLAFATSAGKVSGEQRRVNWPGARSRMDLGDQTNPGQHGSVGQRGGQRHSGDQLGAGR